MTQRRFKPKCIARDWLKRIPAEQQTNIIFLAFSVSLACLSAIELITLPSLAHPPNDFWQIQHDLFEFILVGLSISSLVAVWAIRRYNSPCIAFGETSP